MKKLFVLTFTLIISAALLSACKNNTNNYDISENDVSIPQTSTAQKTNTILNKETKPFCLAAACDLTIYGSGNEQGYYEIFENPDTSKNIMFTDYNAHRQIFLCAQPNCEHDSETCTSWIAPTSAQVYPVAMKDNLALVFSDRENFSKVELLNNDGSDRHILYQFGSGVQVEAGAASNDKFLVIKINTSAQNSAEEVTTTPSLCAINLSDGTMSDLYTGTSQTGSVTEPGSLSLFFRGVTNTGFIIKTIELNDYKILENVDPSETVRKATIHTVYEIPFNGGEIKKLLKYTQGEKFEEAYGDYLFYLSNDGAEKYSLMKLNTQTLQESTIVADFSQTNISTNISKGLFNDVFIRNIVDDNLILNFMDSNTMKENGDIEVIFKNYAVDINTGALTELSLSNYYSATQVPVDILASFGDNLLVQAKIEEVLNKDSSLPQRIRSLGIISKDDYIKSSANYQMIDSLRKAQ